MKECNESSSCNINNQTESLNHLKEGCLKNDTCVAVSCDVNPSDEKICNRYMFSGYCNESTIEMKGGWTYHLMNPGMKMTMV